MRLTEFLSESNIKVPLSGQTREEVIRELIQALRATDRADTAGEAIFESVMERERLMSTGIGQGIALPHGSLPPGGPTFGIALGIAGQPVDFEAIDGEPVQLVFLILSDESQAVLRLRALARISRLLHRAAFRTALASARTSSEAMQVIASEEARHRI